MIYKGSNKKNLRDDPHVKMAGGGLNGVIKKRNVAAAGPDCRLGFHCAFTHKIIQICYDY